MVATALQFAARSSKGLNGRLTLVCTRGRPTFHAKLKYCRRRFECKCGMSKPSKVDVDSFTRPDNPTEEEIDEWTRRSRKEGICGIVDCYNKPTLKCNKCENYYCSEHLKLHFDLLPDGTFEYSRDEEYEGLDHYIH